MKNIFFIWAILGLVINLESCNYWRKPLTIQRRSYLDGKIRMDGIYYNRLEGNFFLYNNGVFLDGGTGWYSFEGLIKDCQKPEYNKYLDVAYIWGVFEINYPNFVIEKWVSGNVGERYNTVKYNGKILNDTTIFLYNYPTGKDTFHFYRLAVKPDSTNLFVK